MTPKIKIDHVISLGYNCEVSFRIRDYFGALNSVIYSWAYIENRDDLLKSLYNPEKLAASDKELLPWGMFRSKEYGITFHPKYSQKELFHADGGENTEVVQLAKEEMVSRYMYLAKKLTGFFQDAEKTTLYVCKMQPWITDEASNIDFIKTLYQTLSDICINDNFMLCIVMQEKDITESYQALQQPNLFIRTVKEFAPDSDTEYGGDIEGWNRIFNEFELKNKTEIVKQSVLGRLIGKIKKLR
ncbi:MAG: hypothetical protein J6C83_00105 [Peptococcaceae bacterium]|nr:hypothetical protein [Peptococcaceae bacterium]